MGALGEEGKGAGPGRGVGGGVEWGKVRLSPDFLESSRCHLAEKESDGCSPVQLHFSGSGLSLGRGGTTRRTLGQRTQMTACLRG